MSEPRFSVITIALNDREGFLATKASCDAQTFEDREWIVIDGGSTDGTLEHLKQFSGPRCTWISECDKGLFDAMNKGLDRATGQYIIFMNSGDKFASRDVLERVNDTLLESLAAPDFVFGDACEETAEGKLLLKPARAPEAIRRGMFTHHQAMFYARHAVTGMRYELRFPVAADYAFTARLLSRGARTMRVPFPVCINKRAGFSENNARRGRQENIVIQREILKVGAGRRAYNYGTFVISNFLRTYMRGFYDRLRFRHEIAA